jgi:hypothetical protein
MTGRAPFDSVEIDTDKGLLPVELLTLDETTMDAQERREGYRVTTGTQSVAWPGP